MPLVNIQDKFIVRTSAGGGVAAPAPSITNTQTNRFTVSWNAVPNAISYRLDVATDSGFTSFVTGYNNKTIAGTSELVTGLSPETTYYVRVRTVAAGSNSSAVSQQTEVAQGTTLTEGLQAFYALSDTTDSSGNGNTLTNNGGVTFASGKIGNAAVMDDGSKQLITNKSLIAGSSAFTASIWVKYDGQKGGSNVIFEIPNVFMCDATQSYLYFTLATTGSEGWYEQCDFALQTNEWTHLVFAYDGTNIKLYKNNILNVTAARGGSVVSGDENSSLKIGCHEGSGNYFSGQIDAVGFWNRALTEGEIAELYNAGAGVEV